MRTRARQFAVQTEHAHRHAAAAKLALDAAGWIHGEAAPISDSAEGAVGIHAHPLIESPAGGDAWRGVFAGVRDLADGEPRDLPMASRGALDEEADGLGGLAL